MIDFPASPIAGQLFTSGTQQWIWDGVKWVPNGSSTPVVVQAMNDNRIINGDMRINQRGVASGTSNGYNIDRWAYQGQQANKGTWMTASPSGVPGFPYALRFVSSSAYTPLASDYFAFFQAIEADQIGDFAWGTASAQSVTLSFWAWCNLAGTFGGCLNGGNSRCYPFSYVLAASTWTKVIINIPGDTAGTWTLSGNAVGLYVYFDLGSGATFRAPAGAWAAGSFVSANGTTSVVATNAITFNLTGVKLETGSIATPFNRQSLARSLADCQRYYSSFSFWYAQQAGVASQNLGQTITYPITMRAVPSISFSSTVFTNASGMTAYNTGITATSVYVTSGTSGTIGAQATMTMNAEL